MVNKKQTTVLVVFIFLLVIGSLGICLNYMLENMLLVLNKSNIYYYDDAHHPDSSYYEDDDAENEYSYTGERNNLSTKPGFPSQHKPYDDSFNSGSERQDNTSPESAFPSDQNRKDNISKEDIAREALEKAGRPVDKKDLIAGGLIILHKLSRSEIQFLYEVARKDTYTREELIKANNILITKLNSEDRAKLKALGLKYGRNLRVLDEDFEP